MNDTNNDILQPKQDGGICPACGAPIPDDAPSKMCPSCLAARIMLATQNSVAGGPFTPPSIEEVQGLIPGVEIEAELGHGGMGAVYKGVQTSLNRAVAVKLLPLELSEGDPTFKERFHREAETMARLSHQNIVTVYDFGETAEGHCYIVMEYIEGLNLHQMIHGGKITPAEAMALIPQICDALQFAHDRGVIHRDIKPANILVDTNGGVKLTDFGLAKLFGDDVSQYELTMADVSMGTPYYVAPEQARHEADLDHRVDIYSLGVVLYELLTGQVPRGAFELPSKKKVEIDVRLDEVVIRAMQSERELRYQQVSEIKTKVDEVRSDPMAVPKPAEESSPKGRMQVPLARNIAIVAVLLLGAALAWKGLQKPDAIENAPLGEATSILSEGLVAYYPFDGNANDESGNGHDGAVIGAVPTADRFGNAVRAYSFDGLDDYIKGPEANHVWAEDNFTLSMWLNSEATHDIYPERISGGPSFNQRYVLTPSYGPHLSDGGTDTVGVGISAGINGISVYQGTHYSLPAVLVYQAPLNGWIHAVLVYSHGVPSLFVNGKCVKQGLVSNQRKVIGYSNKWSQSKEIMGLGRVPNRGNGAFKGAVDDVRIYDRALTGDEVGELYKLEKPKDFTPGSLAITPSDHEWSDSGYEYTENSVSRDDQASNTYTVMQKEFAGDLSVTAKVELQGPKNSDGKGILIQGGNGRLMISLDDDAPLIMWSSMRNKIISQSNDLPIELDHQYKFQINVTDLAITATVDGCVVSAPNLLTGPYKIGVLGSGLEVSDIVVREFTPGNQETADFAATLANLDEIEYARFQVIGEPAEKAVTTMELRDGAKPWTNRDHVFADLPQNLQGRLYYQYTAQSKHGRVLEVSKDGLVYIIVSDDMIEGLRGEGWKKMLDASHRCNNRWGTRLHVMYQFFKNGDGVKIADRSEFAGVMVVGGPLKLNIPVGLEDMQLSFEDLERLNLLDKPVFIENVHTKRYLFSDGKPIEGRRGAEGGWKAISGFESPKVVGADANYEGRACWKIIKSGRRDIFHIENCENQRWLFSDGSVLKGGRGLEGGWLAHLGFESPSMVGADGNYYNRALWKIYKVGDKFIIENCDTKRYLFSAGKPIEDKRGAEGGWLASTGFQSPKVVGTDANYENRAYWRILPQQNENN